MASGDPERFLRVAEGRARGFWARGPRWAAHAGVLASLADPGGPGRTGRIREAGARVAGTQVEPDGLRFYGGFAFRDRATTGGWWDGFPPALFHLPEVEFDGEGEGEATLRVRALAGPETDIDEIEAWLEREADDWVARMARAEVGPPLPTLAARTDEGNRIAWESAVERTLEAIRGGEVTKAVLARTLDVELAAVISPVDLVLALWRQHTGTHAFLFEPEPGRALLGAAPEALATLRDGVFAATAVAGSVGVGESEPELRELAAGLLASTKDRAEQKIVTDDMVHRLDEAGHEVAPTADPHVLTLARIQHLETEITARVAEETDALDVVETLHPTPAVGGLPQAAALDFLARTEPFERGWYAGPVGWFDPSGDGHFVPALRTAVGDGRRWRLFAGAGIVEGSVPSSEWEETAIKFQPVLRALAECGARL